jgi:DNA primase
MAIDFDAFLDWAESHYDVFGEPVVSGSEVKLNSIFRDDTKKKLWCNPDGGKSDREFGVYHCWKSDEKGTLVGLVMKVEGVSFNDALDILKGGATSLYELEKKVEELFSNNYVDQEEEQEQAIPISLELPPFTYLLTDLPPGNPFRYNAEKYLISRKLPIEGLYVCTDGRKYKNRIVIPYYDRNGNLFYFNCRALDDRQPKYLGPDKSLGIGKGDVMYMVNWPENGAKVHIAEGEFDAKALYYLCGLEAGALGGKNISEVQIRMLMNYIPILVLDNDSAGKEALINIGNSLIANSIPTFYIRPPEGSKDWNDLLLKTPAEVVKRYVEEYQKPFTNLTKDEITSII